MEGASVGTDQRALCWDFVVVFNGAFLFFVLLLFLCDPPRKWTSPEDSEGVRQTTKGSGGKGGLELGRRGAGSKGGTHTTASFDNTAHGLSFSGAGSPTRIRPPTSIRPLNSQRHDASPSTSRRIQPEKQSAGLTYLGLTYLAQPRRQCTDSQESFANLAAAGPADYTSQVKSTRPVALWPDFEMAAAPFPEPLDLGAPATELSGQSKFAMKTSWLLSDKKMKDRISSGTRFMAAAPSPEPLDLGAPATELGGQNFLLEFARKKSRVLSAGETLKGKGKMRDGHRARISSGTRFLVRSLSNNIVLGLVTPPRSSDAKNTDLKNKDKRRQATRVSHPSTRGKNPEEIPLVRHISSSSCPARIHESGVGSSSALTRWSNR